MKLKFLIVFLFAITSLSYAQNTIWYTDAHKAVAQSNKSNKPLLVFFTGSDWCGWCKRLQKEVFATPEFIKWANEKVVLLEIDFPRVNKQPENIKKQNQQIQQVFGVQGYPTVWFVSAQVDNGKTQFIPIGRSGYAAGGAPLWIENANSILKNK